MARIALGAATACRRNIRQDLEKRRPALAPISPELKKWAERYHNAAAGQDKERSFQRVDGSQEHGDTAND